MDLLLEIKIYKLPKEIKTQSKYVKDISKLLKSTEI